MNTNDVRNTAGEAIGPMDSSADRVGGAVADLSGSAIATIWRGQKQLRQRVLTANSSGSFLGNISSPAFRGAGIARTPQVATGG